MKTSVWVVKGHQTWECSWEVGIYSSREKAERARDDEKQQIDEFGETDDISFSIWEWDLDSSHRVQIAP